MKNPVEIEGARAAHRRDGAAVTRFLAWFDREAPHGKLTEIDAVEALESFRRETGLLKDVSFPTISGAGPNGAIVHYRVTRKTDRTHFAGRAVADRFRRRNTRTAPPTSPARSSSAKPTAEMRDRFTRVLKGHIAIATRGVSRRHQRRAARSVRRGERCGRPASTSITAPATASAAIFRCTRARARISKLGTVALKRGMILSNEPGYYKTGGFGIRIENLVLVVEGPAVAGAEKPLNAFETLTLAPIDRRLVQRDLLTTTEVEWLDAYHARVRAVLMPVVDADTATWLEAATAPLA